MQEPNVLLFLLHVAGAAALLIWSVRLVRTGVERAFAFQLRLWLRRSTKSRVLAAATGMLSAILLQSSTAAAMLVSNFVSGGTLAAAVGLAILLGADLGSALVVQVLLVRQTFLVPVLLLVGVGLFLRGRRHRVRQSGRILIGLALIFVSLDLIRQTVAPLVDSEALLPVMSYLGRDMLSAFMIGAAFAWAVHSSVAAVLLFVTLVAQGLIPQSVAVAMVLGANLGGSMIAYILTLSFALEARRIIVANLVLRGGGAAFVLAGLTIFNLPLAWLGGSAAQQVIYVHVLFNFALAALALPFVGQIVRLTEALMVRKPDAGYGTGRNSALDPLALEIPDRALSCASRELLHMGETIEAMLRAASRLYLQWDDMIADEIGANAGLVRKMHFEMKLYLARLNRQGLEEEHSRRSMEMATVAVNLEAAAEVIARNLVGLARRLETEGVDFSEKGKKEISDFHDRVLSNAQLALKVMMTLNPDDARELVSEKDYMRSMEQKLQRSHLGRLREGRTESIETSDIHQETLRALKQVNTSFSMVAYPILSETGDLLESRLSDRRDAVSS